MGVGFCDLPNRTGSKNSNPDKTQSNGAYFLIRGFLILNFS